MQSMAVNSSIALISPHDTQAEVFLSEELGIDMESTGDTHRVNLENLMIHIRNNPILTAIPRVEERFFEQAVIDIYINNTDRNNGNWGILRHSDGSPDTIAPIYDNGGSFQDKLSDAKAARILEDKDLAKVYACGTQTAYADRDNRIYSASRFLELRKIYPKLNEALIKIKPLIEHHQKDIEALIDELPDSVNDREGNLYDVCGNHIKELYKLQLNARFERLIVPEWKKTVSSIQPNDLSARFEHSHDDDLER